MTCFILRFNRPGAGTTKDRLSGRKAYESTTVENLTFHHGRAKNGRGTGKKATTKNGREESEQDPDDETEWAIATTKFKGQSPT